MTTTTGHPRQRMWMPTVQSMPACRRRPHGQCMYTMRRDAPLACTFNEAGKYVCAETRCAWPQGLARALQGRVERAIRQSRGDRRLRRLVSNPAGWLVVLTQGQLLRVGAALRGNRTSTTTVFNASVFALCPGMRELII